MDIDRGYWSSEPTEATGILDLEPPIGHTTHDNVLSHGQRRTDTGLLLLKTYSVLRLPVRPTEPSVGTPQLEPAPVSVKRVELNRSHRRLGYGR